MKRILLIAIALVMVFALAACGEKEPNPSGNGTSDPGTSSQQTPSGTESGNPKDALVSKVGDVMSFGTNNGKAIEWQALAIDQTSHKALLVTKDCMALDVWNEPNGEQEVVWADSTLRAWLNGEFYNSFSAEEQAMILPTELKSNENNGYDIYPDEVVEWKTTTDNVFLLSADEVVRYFADYDARCASVYLSDDEVDAAITREIDVLGFDRDNAVQSIEALNGKAVEYWLRSNGRGYMIQTVYGDGILSDYGTIQNTTFKGVRPAIWVDISIDN